MRTCAFVSEVCTIALVGSMEAFFITDKAPRARQEGESKVAKRSRSDLSCGGKTNPRNVPQKLQCSPTRTIAKLQPRSLIVRLLRQLMSESNEAQSVPFASCCPGGHESGT